MKKQRNRQRPNGKKARQKSTQRVTSSNRLEKWSQRYRERNPLNEAALALGLASAALGGRLL